MDLPTAITIAVGTITAGGISLKIFGNNNTGKGISSEQCAENREAIQQDLDRGDASFQEIRRDLKKQSIMIARIDERTQIWAKKNGYENA